jgi:hypothetical protein
MYTWDVYLERAETDEPASPLGTIQAETEAKALEQAAQFYEIPSHHLVVKRADEGDQQQLDRNVPPLNC